jgi:hypothetical protein
LAVVAVIAVGIVIRPSTPDTGSQVQDTPEELPVVLDVTEALPGNQLIGGENCSQSSDQSIDVEVRNSSGIPLDYLWVDFECREQFAGSLANGGTATLSTMVNHVFRFVDSDSGVLYYEYIVDEGNEYVEILEQSILNSSQKPFLYVGGNLISNDGTNSFELQADGNLVLWDSGAVVWESNTGGNADIAYLKMQEDGNLVLYGQNERFIWDSGSSQDPPASGYKLVLQDDGNLVIYTLDDEYIWDLINMVINPR